jgi:hypothetical protein
MVAPGTGDWRRRQRGAQIAQNPRWRVGSDATRKPLRGGGAGRYAARHPYVLKIRKIRLRQSSSFPGPPFANRPARARLIRSSGRCPGPGASSIHAEEIVTRIHWALALGSALSLGCASPTLESRHDTAAAAIAALQKGQFDDAEKLARERAAADAENPYTRLVGAVVRYKKSMHQLALDGRTLVFGGLESGRLNQKYLRTALGDAEAELAAVEEDLAIVAREPRISMELCIACWEIDWNGNGRVDDRDRLLFQIEQDWDGNPIPEDDPRRKPTFRFDNGDIAWARAFVSFERAALDVLLAYDWTEAAKLAGGRRERPSKIVIPLIEPERIAQARQRILDGLSQSDASRRAYLAETDDDREWVPSPKQKSHPMPMPVDQALYDTWEAVVGDVQRLVEGEEGLPVGDLFLLAEMRVKDMPRGYLDIGSMLAHPKDIVLDVDDLERLDRARDVEGTLKAALGQYYVPSMKPSPLTGRLLRMKSEIDEHEGELERKLRYLLWLN